MREVTRICRRLQKVRGFKQPITVIWHDMGPWAADVGFSVQKQAYLIRLNPWRITTKDELIDTLIHEHAHILSHGTTVPHGRAWGEAFAQIYRSYHKTR